MNKTKFTPGPWNVCNSNYSKDCKYVQLGEEDYTTTELLIPDAHLIAAAPELYGALEYLLRLCAKSEEDGYSYLGTETILRPVIENALAKARGEA